MRINNSSQITKCCGNCAGVHRKDISVRQDATRKSKN